MCIRDRVGVERTGWPPFDMVENGRYQGISADYLRLLGERLGVQIDAVYFDNWEQAQAALREGKIDILPSVARTPERERWMRFSDPYLISSSLIFSRPEVQIQRVTDLAGKRVAIERGYVPVSYTHLDVYKRQPRLRAAQRHGLRHGRAGPACR